MPRTIVRKQPARDSEQSPVAAHLALSEQAKPVVQQSYSSHADLASALNLRGLSQMRSMKSLSILSGIGV